MAKGSSGSASGRPAKACTCLCVAEHPVATCEDTTELRCRMKDRRAQEHKTGRILKGRHIDWVILQSYKITEVDDCTHDSERLQLIRMRDDDIT
eukprot:2210256-Pyramimonas_sp.AAC.1